MPLTSTTDLHDDPPGDEEVFQVFEDVPQAVAAAVEVVFPLGGEAVVPAQPDHRHPHLGFGLVARAVADGLALGDLPDLVHGAFGIADPPQTEPLLEAEPTEEGGADADGVHVHLGVAHEGVGIAAVGHAGLVSGCVEPLDQAVEGLKLGLGRLFVAERAVEVGKDAADHQILHILVDRDDLVRILRLEAEAAHAGIDAEMDLGHRGAGRGDAVDGNGGFVGADGQDRVEIQQLVDLGGVGGGAEHQDRRVGELTAKLFDLLDLGDGEPVDAVFMQELGERDHADAVAVALEHAPDRDRTGKAPDRLDVVNQRLALDHVDFHDDTSFSLVQRAYFPRFLIR